MLYLVATPIGNLEDISFRAISTLKSSHIILCEDTRHSRILMQHYEITTPLQSYHQFNEKAQEEEIITRLQRGEILSLISDAGTPGISDPGQRLVQRCVLEGIEVQSIPGACAVISALICSGFSTEPFQFIGFLPRKEGEIKQKLIDILLYSGTSICYESPKRLIKVLEILKNLAPNRRVTLARELTKKFEQIQRSNALELYLEWKEKNPRGEIVLIIEGEESQDWSAIEPEEHIELLMEQYQLSRSEAIKMTAKLRGVPKREIAQRVFSSR